MSEPSKEQVGVIWLSGESGRGVKRRARGLAAALFASVLCAPAVLAQPEKVVIGISSRSFNPGFSNMWIGIPLGLYGPNLQPESLGTQGASENLQLMLAGSITLSTGTQDVILSSMAEGRNLPAVSPCVYLRGMIHRVSVTPDSPIKSFADLKGKRVGVPALASGQVPYAKFAASAAGVDPDTLQLIAVGNGQQAAVALTGGSVDALVHADVDVASLQAAGVKLRVLDQPETMKDAAVGYTFAFARPWYNENKKEAAQLLQGMIKAIIVMLENPDAAVRISYHMHPEAIPAGVPFEKAVADAVNAVKIRAPIIERNVGGSNKWCEFPESAWKKYVEIIGLKGKVDPMKFYTDELVDEVNKFDEPKFREWARSLKVPASASEFQSWVASVRAP